MSSLYIAGVVNLFISFVNYELGNWFASGFNLGVGVMCIAAALIMGGD